MINVLSPNTGWPRYNRTQKLASITNSLGVNVWTGLCSSSLIGPFFFDNKVAAESYLKMLNKKLWPIVSKHDDCALYFQQDGAPTHYAVSVRKWLDEHFPDRWIGCRGFME